MKKYVIGDAHCDTASSMYRPFNLYKSDGHTDIRRMKKYKNYFQVFAIWLDDTCDLAESRKKYRDIRDEFYSQLEENSGDIAFIRSSDDIDKAFAENKIAAMLSLEGTSAIGSDLNAIDDIVNDGVRLITITWNHNNPLASAAADENPGYGLTDLGKEAIAILNDKKIIIDVSHMSERGFWDVAKVSKAPFAATHSNSKEICPHPRNLTDEQFLFLKENRGYVGINFYANFLSEHARADINDILRHIDRFLTLGGEDIIGLGSDFDGCDIMPKGIDGCEDVYKIAKKLSELYGEKTAEKICFKNLYNFIKRTID